MTSSNTSTRDIILRTDRWAEALHFYEVIMKFAVTYRSDSLVGFETGAFCLYVEHGLPHGPVFEFLTVSVENRKERLLAAGCTVIEENPAVPRCYVADPFGMVFNIGPAPGGA